LPVAALPRGELVRVGHYVRVATGPCDELDEGARAGTAAPSETFVECRCRGSDKPIDTGGLDGEARCTHVALHRGTPTTSAPRRTLWWVTTIACAVGVALAVPEWVPRGWTREDGPVEYAGFACFLGASVLAFVAASRTRRAHRPALAAAALGAVLLVAAGEEISWGQRLFGVETPAVLVDGNRQDELNLHNIDGLQQKAIIGQLAIAGAGVLLPWFVPRPWARSGLSFFAGYLAYVAHAASPSWSEGAPLAGTPKRPSSCSPSACWPSPPSWPRISGGPALGHTHRPNRRSPRCNRPADALAVSQRRETESKRRDALPALGGTWQGTSASRL
jgi:hypothetical protein